MPISEASGSRSALSRHAEILLATTLLCAAAAIDFATVSDYGIGVDEWNADDYGHKALAGTGSGKLRFICEGVRPLIYVHTLNVYETAPVPRLQSQPADRRDGGRRI
jgi:hypothetical protein